MKTTLATALLFSSSLLYGQVPNVASAPNLAGVPRPTPTRPPAGAAAPPVLHVGGNITNLGCGHPLEFDIVVSNTSSTSFSGGANLRIAGPGLNHPPQLEGSIHAGVGPIGGSSSQTFHLTASPVRVDCAAPESFVVTLTPGVNNHMPYPQWDRDALELKTSPPTSCTATGGSQRQPNWSPKL